MQASKEREPLISHHSATNHFSEAGYDRVFIINPTDHLSQEHMRLDVVQIRQLIYSAFLLS